MALGRRGLLLLAFGAGPLAAASDWEEGIAHYAAERYRESQASFERALESEPENSEYALWLGLAIGRRAERMTGLRRLGAFSLAKSVLRMFEKAAELDSTNLAALEALQQFHLSAPGVVGGSKSEAREIALRIEALDGAEGAAAWARYYERLGEFDSAAERYARARQLDPQDLGHLLDHAAFLARRGLTGPSDELLDEAFARDPENPDVALTAAKAWIRAKRRALYPRARKLIESYLTSSRREPTADPPSQVRKLLKEI